MRSRIDYDTAGHRRHSLLLTLAAGLAVLTPVAARADTAAPIYKSERVIQSGEQAGTVAIPPSYRLFMGGISDTGQVVFSAGTIDRSRPELLFQYAGGKFTPIVMPTTGPAGASPGDVVWPRDIALDRPASVNASGNVVFSADHSYGTNPYGTFLWNASTGHTTALALRDMPATYGLTFVNPGGYSPAINSSNEVALIGLVKNAAGTRGWGLFRLGRDGVLEPVCRPHETVTLGSGDGKYVWDPGNTQISINANPMPSIDDSGRVAFLAHPDGSGRQNAYLWVHDAVTPILTVGASGAPLGGKFTSIKGVFLNNTNAWALVVATTDVAGSSRYGLFRVVNGQTAAVALPGQGMPGGGQLRTVQYAPTSDENSVPSVAVSPANELGEHVFLATLMDGTQAIYKIDQYGGLSFVANDTLTKPEATILATTPRLTFVPGSRPSINKRGQIAFAARYGSGPDMIVLMTPR